MLDMTRLTFVVVFLLLSAPALAQGPTIVIDRLTNGHMLVHVLGTPEPPIAAPRLAARVRAEQTIIKNPSGVSFTSPDHDMVDNYEIDIVRVSDGVVIQTIQGGHPAADASGTVTVTFNIQPIAFGEYRVVVRAVAGTQKSDNSDPSEVWSRAPGRPTNVRIGP